MTNDQLSLKLISRILDSEDELKVLLENNFSPVLISLRWAACSAYILLHYSKYGQLPSVTTLKKKYPEFKKIKAKEPAAYYWKTILTNKKILQVMNLISDLNEANVSEDTVDTLIDEAMEILYKIQGKFTDDSSMPESFRKLLPKTMDRYRRKLDGEITGLPIPFEILRSKLKNWDYGKLQIVVARAGVGKTWYACINAMAAAKQDFKILLISMEMSKEELTRRLLAIGAKVNFGRFTQGIDMKPDDNTRINQFTKEVNETNLGDNIIIVGPGSITKPTLLEPYIKLYKPDLVIVDSFYMQTEVEGKDPKEKIDNLLKAYRNITSTNKIHMMLTSQFNRSARGSDSSNEFAVAFTDHVNFVADVIVVMVRNQYLKDTNQIEIGQAKVRDGESHVVGRYNWNFETMNFDCTEVVDKNEDGEADEGADV